MTWLLEWKFVYLCSTACAILMSSHVIDSSIRLWDECINTLRQRQNGRHFPDNIFKCIFLNENVWILNTIWLKFVPKGPIDNNTALVQKMALHQSGDKPLSEPMMA